MKAPCIFALTFLMFFTFSNAFMDYDFIPRGPPPPEQTLEEVIEDMISRRVPQEWIDAAKVMNQGTKRVTT